MPPYDPDSLPDSEDPGGPCPRCGRIAAFRRGGDLTLDQVTEYQGIDIPLEIPVQRVTALICYGCEQGTAVIEKRMTTQSPTGEPDEYWQGVHWYPPPGLVDLDEAIPETTRSTYGEAMRCMSVRSYRAAVVMLRRALETVVHDMGSDAARKALDRNLAKALEIMADEGSLERNLAEWATEIRLVGNVGAHFDPVEDVAPEEADDLQHLTRRLLEYVYEMPARLRRSRSKP